MSTTLGHRNGKFQMFTTLTCLAAMSFSIGGYFMKSSAGLTNFRPTILMFAFFIAGASLQTIAMCGRQMLVTYIVVLGLEGNLCLFARCHLSQRGKFAHAPNRSRFGLGWHRGATQVLVLPNV